MNRQDFTNKWHNLKNKVKQKWNKLNDQDVSGVNGKYDELSSKLQHKYGWDKAHAEREINEWCSHCEDKSCGTCDKNGQKREGHDYNEGSQSNKPKNQQYPQHNRAGEQNQWDKQNPQHRAGEQKKDINQWDKQKKQPRKDNEGPEEKRRKAG